MSDQELLMGEHFPHKVSAQFASQEMAEQAVQRLVNNAALPREQINIVHPQDPNIARKLEPEVRGIGRTLVKSHLRLGIGGLVLGLVVAAILTTMGPALTRSSPLFTFIALGFLFPALSLMLAGLISLRPDHDPLIAQTRTATESGQWTLIAHCATTEQQERVNDTINTTAQTL